MHAASSFSSLFSPESTSIIISTIQLSLSRSLISCQIGSQSLSYLTAVKQLMQLVIFISTWLPEQHTFLVYLLCPWLFFSVSLIGPFPSPCPLCVGVLQGSVLRALILFMYFLSQFLSSRHTWNTPVLEKAGFITHYNRKNTYSYIANHDSFSKMRLEMIITKFGIWLGDFGESPRK